MAVSVLLVGPPITGIPVALIDIGLFMLACLPCCASCLCVLFATVVLHKATCFMVISSPEIFLAPLSISPARPVALHNGSCVCDAYSLEWRSRRASSTDQRVVRTPRLCQIIPVAITMPSGALA